MGKCSLSQVSSDDNPAKWQILSMADVWCVRFSIESNSEALCAESWMSLSFALTCSCLVSPNRYLVLSAHI